MAIGDVTNPKRVRFQANERLDTGDADAVSGVARDHLDAWSRAVEAAPRNVGSSTPTGFIFQGFGLTLNPTGPSDNKVRVQSALGVALDANGRFLIKENGVQVDLTLSAGNTQVYAYYVESSSDTTVRRFISVSSPFAEGGQSVPTKLAGGVGFYTRSGDQTSIVASDVVNGATTALCFLGVASNSGGAVTMTGYNATTAPNGAFATNRLPAVAQPTTLPTTNTMNGSIATMHGFANAALYMVGQLAWKGSKNFTPSAANNFGAYTTPTVGVDALFDSQAETTLTPTTVWRDWQQNRRFLIDHQGYPGGQISVRDEHWNVPASTTISVDPMIGSNITGSVVTTGAAPYGVFFSASGASWVVSGIHANIPLGAVITGITVWYTSTNGASTLTAALSTQNLTGGSPVTQVSRTVTTSTLRSFDVMVTPTSGHGPKVVRSIEKLALVLTTPSIASGSVTVYDIQIAYRVPPVGWTAVLDGSTDSSATGDAINFAGPVSGLNHANAQLVTSPGAGFGQIGLLGVQEVWVDDDLAHSMDFVIKTGTVVDATNTFQFGAYVGPQIFLGASSLSWGITRLASGANWQLQLRDDTALTTVNTGVAFASNTTYRIKLEYQGANRNSSGHARVRLWINSTLVATATSASTVTPQSLNIQIGTLASDPGTGPYDLRIGRIHRAWNHTAAGDNV